MDTITIGSIYVVPEGNGSWVIHGTKSSEHFGRFNDREAAIAAGRSLAMDKGFLLIVKRSQKEVDYTEDYASVNH